MIAWLFPDIRKSEENRFRYFLGLAALLFASQSSAMTVCESLLLSRLGIQALPYSVLLASGLTMISSYLYSRWVGRHRHEDSLLYLIGIAVVIVLGSIPFVLAGSEIAYVMIFGFHFVTFTIFAGHLQALAGDYFDTLASKRVLPLIGVGATAGEIVGGLSSSTLTGLLPIETLLGLWAAFLVGAALHTLRYRSRLLTWNPNSQPSKAVSLKSQTSQPILKLIGSSPLNFSLLSMVCFMILTMSMVQYVVSDVFVTSFPNENQLASFFGIFVACSNAAELVVASKVTPRLLRQFGVANCNTLHAFGALLTLILLWNSYALVPALLCWMNRKTFHDALAGPVRRLVFNAVEQKQRVRLMAFIDGVAGSAARAVASFSIFLLQSSWNAKTFILPGLLFAVLYLLSALAVGKRYFQSLVGEIADGKVDLGALAREPEQLPIVWAETLKNPEQADLKSLAEGLDAAGLEALLIEATRHHNPTVQVVAIQQLGSRCPPECLGSSQAEVRLEAAKAIWPHPELLAALEDDPNSEVRDLARATSGKLPVGESLLSIRYQHDKGLDDVMKALQSKRAERQVAAIERLAGVESVKLNLIFEKTRHPSTEVAEAAVSALAQWSDPLAIVLLTRCLEAPVAHLRRTASRALSSKGECILPHLSVYFRAERLVVAESAYEALVGLEGASTKTLLGQELRLWVREAWKHLVLHERVLSLQQADLKFLELALLDRADRCQRLAFKTLSLLEGDRVVGSVVSSLKFSEGAKRATALEVLSNLGDREAAALLVLLTEPTPLAERLKQAVAQSPALSNLPKTRKEVLLQCLQSAGRFVRLGALTLQQTTPSRKISRLLTLRRFELFRGLTLEELEAVAGLLREERFSQGQTILSPDRPCDRIYLTKKGTTSQSDSGVCGVVSALDQGPSLEHVVAMENCQFLTLNRQELFDMVRRQPAVSFPIIELLTKRLKSREKALRGRI